jgi:hypothetical protein
MPTVEITVTERVTYSRQVEMTQAEFSAWDNKLDTLKGREYDEAVEELTEAFIRRDERDWQDADDLELLDMKVVV